MNNHYLYRVSDRFEVSKIGSRICQHIARLLKRSKQPLSIDQIARRVERTLPTENQVPTRTVVAWHVRHNPYFVRAGRMHLPPKKQPAREKRAA